MVYFSMHLMNFSLCFSAHQASKRLDYLEWHQDLITPAPSIDLEIFRIENEGLFMATASFDNRVLSKQPSSIFKWEQGRFRLYQSLTTLGAQGWVHFRIGRQVSWRQ